MTYQAMVKDRLTWNCVFVNVVQNILADLIVELFMRLSRALIQKVLQRRCWYVSRWSLRSIPWLNFPGNTSSWTAVVHACKSALMSETAHPATLIPFTDKRMSPFVSLVFALLVEMRGRRSSVTPPCTSKLKPPSLLCSSSIRTGPTDVLGRLEPSL